MLRIISTIALILTLFITGCSQKTLSEADRSTSNDSTLQPDSETFGATIYLYDRDEVKAEVRADLIRRFVSIDSIMGYKVDIDFLDSLGEVSTNLVGDSGIIRETTNLLEVFGKVVAVTSDGGKLETDYLVWNPDEGKIRTDAYVKFTRGEDIMTGWGMEADPDLGRLRILSQVSGSVTESAPSPDSSGD